MWILKLKSVDSEEKSVDSEAKKCGFVKKNSHFFHCLLPKVWFNKSEKKHLSVSTLRRLYTAGNVSFFTFHLYTVHQNVNIGYGQWPSG